MQPAALTETPIEAKCSRKFTAFHDDGDRPTTGISLIVLHSTEGGTAESVARYFTLPQSGGSAHLVIDDLECFRCLDNTDIARAAPGANAKGFHIEQCGFAKWSATTWLLHRQTLRRAAYKAAYHCVLFGLPPVFRFAADLELGRPGVTTHRECTRAFGGTHTDPGVFWPRRVFMSYVRGYYAGISL